jgi:hypothetical protein
VKRRASWVATAALAAGMVLASAVPALGECASQGNVWPKFTEVAPTAQRIVIGRVFEGRDQFERGYHIVYGLEIQEVLRGSAPAEIEIDALRSGMPLTGTVACQEDAYLAARVGHVIAIAFQGHVAGVPGRVTTAAWIEGKPDQHTFGAQRLTLAEVHHAAGLPDTAAEASEDGSPATTVWLGVALFAGSLLAVAFRRRRLPNPAC